MKKRIEKEIEFPTLTEAEWTVAGRTMLSLHFMDTVKKCFPSPFKNKDLAKAIGSSTAHASQLCNGNRLLNIKTLQSIQKEMKVNLDLVIRFDVGDPRFSQSTLVLQGSQFINSQQEAKALDLV